ncbi:DDE-type integrase/transposase/recombinase [Streptomyces massasporeus]|uniref:DDE-type integrase/transposase/recombinase n=1 Tax=Streptomyces massasporeus TaxID=67324 RepID=UPI0016761414|nr:DDE-type integrase/transposase/recombinase [Streptomyces massasporeus]
MTLDLDFEAVYLVHQEAFHAYAEVHFGTLATAEEVIHAWTEAHVAVFRYFGGVPRRFVPDNLKTGVDKPDLYDPKINKAHGELAPYYGALVDLVRAAKPKDKPRVERPMPYVRDSFWRGPGVHFDRAHAGRGRDVESAGCRAAGSADRWAAPPR